MLSQNRLVGTGALLGITFIWGMTFVIVQQAIEQLPPFTFNFIRFALAALFIALYLLLFNRTAFSWSRLKSQLWPGFFLGVFLFLGYALQTFSLLYTTPGKSGFLTGLSVALVPILSFFILRQKPRVLSIVGVVAAVIGLYLLAFTNIHDVNVGDFLAFLCAFAFGLQLVYTGKVSAETSVLVLVFVQLVTVTLLNGLLAIIFEPIVHIQSVFAPKVIMALLVTSLLATVLAYIGQTFFQKTLSPSSVALIFTMEPVFAALGDYLWNGTTFGMRALIGCLCILLGMLLAEIPVPSALLKMKKRRSYYSE